MSKINGLIDELRAEFIKLGTDYNEAKRAVIENGLLPDKTFKPNHQHEINLRNVGPALAKLALPMPEVPDVKELTGEGLETSSGTFGD